MKLFPCSNLEQSAMPLGFRIKYLRQHHKTSLTELLRSAGISKSTWHRAEKGEDVTVSTLQSIADALGVNLVITFEERTDEQNAPVT